MKFFYIVQKLGDDNCFFLFEVELNFCIKACLFLLFQNVLKKLKKFIFSLLQINIILCFSIIF